MTDDDWAPWDVEHRSRATDLELRAAARERGAATYIGRRCRVCGDARRYTNRGKCCVCLKARNERYYATGTGMIVPLAPIDILRRFICV